MATITNKSQTVQFASKSKHTKTYSSPLLDLKKSRSSFDFTTTQFAKIKKTQNFLDHKIPTNAGRNSLVQFLTDQTNQEDRKARTSLTLKEADPKKNKNANSLNKNSDQRPISRKSVEPEKRKKSLTARASD